MVYILSIMKTDAINRAIQVFRKHGGVLHTSGAVSHGIHPRTLYALRDDGTVQAISHGLYCLRDHALLNQPDLVAAALRVPKGVVCLTSALAFHDITTQVPHEVSMAIPRRMRSPVIDYPPMRFHRFSDASYGAGIEKHTVEGVDVRMYSPEKTVADCFKFRHKIGLGVATEALRFCRERKKSSPQQLLHYARICRVQVVMTPYLEAIV